MLGMLKRFYRRLIISSEIEAVEEILFTSKLRLVRLTRRRDELVNELSYPMSEDKKRHYANKLSETMCLINKEDKTIERMEERLRELRDELNKI